MPVSLVVELAGLPMRNPLLNGSGTFGYGTEYSEYVHPNELGALVTKSLTAKPRPGALPYRTVETRSGMLNAIGIANIGVSAFLTDRLPALSGVTSPIIASVAGHTPDDYVEVAAKLDANPRIAAMELNISCPNTADGLEFGTSAAGVKAVVAPVRAAVKRAKILVKLSPNVSDVTATARAAVEAGADALSLINTVSALVIDAETRRPVLGNVTGGLSGPAIKPIALRMVHQVYRAVAKPAGVPIIGMGGIQFGSDAVEFLLAGATAFAVGTALFIDPLAISKILSGLRGYCQRHRITDVRELIGGLQL